MLCPGLAISILVALDKQGHKAKRLSRCPAVFPSADVVSQWGQNSCNLAFKFSIIFKFVIEFKGELNERKTVVLKCDLNRVLDPLYRPYADVVTPPISSFQERFSGKTIVAATLP